VTPDPSEKNLREAYDYCVEVTRQAARNFYYGIRLLRRERFASLCALYAFCRELDDVVDGSNSQDAAQLFARRRQLVAGDTAPNPDMIARAFGDTIAKYGLAKSILNELIDTIESDMAVRHFETMDEVRDYAHGVASTVGLCSVRIFGVGDGSADSFADTLGIALQWTNILRDIEEDHRRGRCYLPQSGLREFDLTVEDLLAGDKKEQVRLWWQAAVKQGREFFRAAGEALPANRRRQLRPAIAMAAVYRQAFEEIARRPGASPRVHSARKLSAVCTAVSGLWNPFR